MKTLLLSGLLIACIVVEVRGTRIIAGRFQRYGRNVCETKKVETESYTQSEVTHFPVSRKTKCGLFGWSRCVVTRRATKTMYVIRTRRVDVIVLHCCDGWQERPSGRYYVCDMPYCRLGCKNGGTCLGGHKCTCAKGWRGELCSIDINECHENNGGCQQACTNTPGSFACGCNKGYVRHPQDKSRCQDLNECRSSGLERCVCANKKNLDCGSVCQNTIGSYRCSCGKGYRLIKPTVCEDIDECLSPSTNKCPLKCVNMPGTYQCDCMRGFRLGEKGTTCEDINECAILNGGCQHKCLNSYGSYACKCRIGYKLHHNRKRCIDMDECKSFHGCQMQCNNIMGSYYCSCPKGFSLQADKFSCSDVDECSVRKVKGLAGNVSLSDCEQQCINTVGSFKCSCKPGFLLRNNGKSCKDSDECTSGTHRCDHKCTNTFGSYVCSCRPGYTLNADRKTCRPVPCESIEQPVNGIMRCNGSRTGATCQFSCEPGYELFGSKSRTCSASSKWTGTKTICKVKSCPDLQVPDNIVVLLPCYKTYKSKCTLQCEQGYYNKNGDGTATCLVEDTGDMTWNLENFQCNELQVCKPSPCRNHGKCSLQGTTYTCDCEGTGFEGTECQTGILSTPVFEKLKVNEQSKMYSLRAQPKNELVVNLQSSRFLIIKPQRELRISKSAKQTTFSIIPLRAGFHSISYSLRGQDAKFFKIPRNSTVYVKPKDSISVYEDLKIPFKSIPLGCYNSSVPSTHFKCQSQLASSHPWDKTRTKGIVYLMTQHTRLPISLFGTNGGTFDTPKNNQLELLQKISSQNMNSSIWINNNGKCEALSMSSLHLLELIQTDAFPHTMFKSVSNLVPKWIHFNVNKNNQLFDISNVMATLRRPSLHGPGSCERLPSSVSNRTVFYKPSVSFTTHIDGESLSFGSSESACFAVDACTNKTYIDFSTNARKTFHKLAAIRNMKTAGWDLSVSSVGISGRGFDEKKDGFGIWMDGKSKISLNKQHCSIKMNLNGEFTTTSSCHDKIFARQFDCSLCGKFKGKLSLESIITLKRSQKTKLKFLSDESAGKFQFGGPSHVSKCALPSHCGSSQGAHITFKAKENPFQPSTLSSHVLPYLQNAMNVSIYHTIEGGGQTGVVIPADMRMKLMILGFLPKPFKTSIQGAVAALPDLQSDLSSLLKTVSKIDALIAKANQVVNTNVQNKLQGKQASEFSSSVSSLNSLISKVLSLSTALSSKLSAHKSKIPAQLLIAGIQSFKQNMKTVIPLKLTSLRSPVKQDLKGLVVGTLAKVCLGQLCIPDVNASINVLPDASEGSLSKHGDCQSKEALSVIARPLTKMKLGKILSAQRNQQIKIRLSPKLLQFDGIINMFGISKDASINVTETRLDTKVKAKIFNIFNCDIEIRADSNVDDWGSLVFKARGKMDGQSDLSKKLEKRLHDHAMDLVQKSKKRVKKAKNASKNATLKTLEAEKLLNSTQAIFESLEKDEQGLRNIFRSKRAQYARVTDWFDNALLSYNITLQNSKSCRPDHCKRICNKTCVQDVCWDKAVVQFQTADCSYVDSAIQKLMSATRSNMISYTTTPVIMKDVGKCKKWGTAFFESVLSFGLYNGRRRKRSIEENQGKRKNKLLDTIDVNEYLRSQDPSLPGNFDVNALFRKRVPQLPKAFDINKVFQSHVLKQHKFDINMILRQAFPALSKTFDIDREILQVLPALKNSFVLDEFLKKLVTEAAQHKTNVNFAKSLEKLSPRLAADFDKILKKSIPQLNNISSITDLVQTHLNNVIKISMDQKKLKHLDINYIMKTKFRGLPANFDINKLWRSEMPQLNTSFEINKIVKNAIFGVGPRGNQLDEIIAKVSGNPGFSLQASLSRQFPGFDKRQFMLEDIITNEIKNSMSVNVNETKLQSLTFDKIVKSALPSFKDHSSVDDILTNSFPVLTRKFELRTLLKGSIPLVKMAKSLKLNELIKSVYPSVAHMNVDLDSALKMKNPALRGQINIERYLVQRLKDATIPNFDTLLRNTYGEASETPLNFENVLKDVIGKATVGDLKNLVQENVFSDMKDENLPPFQETRGKQRNKRFLGITTNLLVGNLVKGVFNANKRSGCRSVIKKELGASETKEYKEIRAIHATKNITIKKWTCENSRMVDMASKGYKPRMCCRADVPCVEFLDPVCVKKNAACFKQKKMEFEIYKSTFNASLYEEFQKLVSTEKEVVNVAMQLEEIRLRKKVALQNVQIVRTRLSQLHALKNTSRIIYNKVKSIPQVHLGFKVARIVGESFVNRPFSVVSLSFKTISSALSKRRLPFQATIKRKRGKDLFLDFILDFDNINSSLTYAAKETIRILTSSTRKRRSLTNPGDQGMDTCSFSRNATSYLTDIVNSLRTVMESDDEQDMKLKEEISALDGAMSSMTTHSSDEREDSAIKGYRHLLSAFRNERQQQTEMTTWNETLVSWKNYIENVTEIRQFENCSGSIDCVEELNERLSEIYLEIRNESDVLTMVKMLGKLTSGIIELLSDDIPREQVKQRLQRLSELLMKTKDENILCSEKPRILTSNDEKIKLLAGKSIILLCNASSSSKIKYYWTKDNLIIQTGKHGTLKLINVQDKDEGLYRCEARNLKGSAFSNVTKIIIEERPQIVEQPFQTQVQLNKDSTVSLSCVATGTPQPSLTWLYRPFSSNISVVIPDESSNILGITPDTIENSGYYFCEAKNSRGLATSREARVDILPVSIASPKMAIIFNATRNCKPPKCQAKQNIPSRITEEMRKTVVSMVTRSIGVPEESITELRYMPFSTSLARMVFYITTAPGNTSQYISRKQMMETFSELRLRLVGKLKRLLLAMDNTVLSRDVPMAPLIGLSDTLGFVHVEPECPAGQWLDDKGYFCVHCPPGSYQDSTGKSVCSRCPKGTYQPRTGQTDCIPCGQHKTTSQHGAIDNTRCIDQVPAGPKMPVMAKAKVLSSSSAKISWMMPQDSFISHYELLMQYGYPKPSVLPTVKVYPSKPEQREFQYLLRNLDKYTEYSVQIYGVLGNKRGQPANLRFRTVEDVPSQSPQITSVLALNSTAVEVRWKHPPREAMNGIVVSYTVYIKESSFSNYRAKQVGPNVLSTIIYGLNDHTIYCVRMTVSTKKGSFQDWLNTKCAWVQTPKAK